jgi:hypothetical protein
MAWSDDQFAVDNLSDLVLGKCEDVFISGFRFCWVRFSFVGRVQAQQPLIPVLTSPLQASQGSALIPRKYPTISICKFCNWGASIMD